MMKRSKVMILVNGGKISLKSLVEERSLLVKGAPWEKMIIPTIGEFELGKKADFRNHM